MSYRRRSSGPPGMGRASCAIYWVILIAFGSVIMGLQFVAHNPLVGIPILIAIIIAITIGVRVKIKGASHDPPVSIMSVAVQRNPTTRSERHVPVVPTRQESSAPGRALGGSSDHPASSADAGHIPVRPNKPDITPEPEPSMGDTLNVSDDIRKLNPDLFK